jgi:hypothetical protein
MRCPECAYISGAIPAAMVNKEAGSLGMASFAGLLTGLAGAYLTALLAFTYPVLPIIAAPLYGRLVADAVTSFSAQGKGQTNVAVGVGSILLGCLIAFGLPMGHLHPAAGTTTAFTQAMVGITIGISVVICYHRLKQRS